MTGVDLLVLLCQLPKAQLERKIVLARDREGNEFRLMGDADNDGVMLGNYKSITYYSGDLETDGDPVLVFWPVN